MQLEPARGTSRAGSIRRHAEDSTFKTEINGVPDVTEATLVHLKPAERRFYIMLSCTSPKGTGIDSSSIN